MSINLQSENYVRMSCRSVREVLQTLGVSDTISVGLPECRNGVADVGWAIEPRALELLVALVRSVKPRLVLELGTYEGETATQLGLVLKELGQGRLVTIDNFSDGDRNLSAKRFSDRGLDQIVTQVECDSSEAFADWGREHIDILIVDAAHDFASACTDIALWSRLLAPNGWMIVHDTRTRLERRFPEDYLHPMGVYDVLDVFDVAERDSTGRWEGIAFVRFRQRDWESHLPENVIAKIGVANWSGALEEKCKI